MIDRWAFFHLKGPSGARSRFPILPVGRRTAPPFFFVPESKSVGRPAHGDAGAGGRSIWPSVGGTSTAIFSGIVDHGPIACRAVHGAPHHGDGLGSTDARADSPWVGGALGDQWGAPTCASWEEACGADHSRPAATTWTGGRGMMMGQTGVGVLVPGGQAGLWDSAAPFRPGNDRGTGWDRIGSPPCWDRRASPKPATRRGRP